MQPRTRKQLVTKTITVPENLQRACDDFNAGRFYESHEHLEEIWQYERGRVRDAYKGLIQIAAAFVHLSRGKFAGADRLLRTGVAYLALYRADGALGFDIEEIAAAAEALHARLLAAGPARVTEVDLRRRPVYRFDRDLLARQAVRDRAWGFDAEGKATEMEITIAA